MAERFVFGFVASSNALPDLVGSRLDARSCRSSGSLA
jgi:hypothetical protein